MPRRGRSRYDVATAEAWRDDLITTPSLPLLTVPTPTPVFRYEKVNRRSIALLDDRRRFRPDRVLRGAIAHDPAANRIVPSGRRTAFAAPSRVSLCAKRKARREIMFAKRIAPGKGIGRGKKRRLNFWSEVSCR